MSEGKYEAFSAQNFNLGSKEAARTKEIAEYILVLSASRDCWSG